MLQNEGSCSNIFILKELEKLNVSGFIKSRRFCEGFFIVFSKKFITQMPRKKKPNISY